MSSLTEPQRTVALDLELGLPGDAAACDACTRRLLEALRGRAGIRDAQVERLEGSRSRLRLRVDPEAISVERVQNIVEQSGAALRSKFAHLAVPVDGLRHERQARMVGELFGRQPGVLHAAAALGARQVIVEFDPKVTSSAALLEVLPRAGIAVAAPVAKDGEAGAHEEHRHGGPFGEHSELVFSLACGVMTGLGWTLGKLDVPPHVGTAAFVAAYLLGSWFTVKEVAVALRSRRFEIDFLMLLAAIGAALLGEWFEGALLLFLFTLGHSLEGFAMGRARRSIEALSKLVPPVALRVDADGAEREVDVGALRIADRILVKPNSRIPADGIVVAGSSAVDQSPITGESIPVDKRPAPDTAATDPASLPTEHRVFAGTINGTGTLTVRVVKVAADSTLARVAKLVAEAESQPSPTQRLTDRFEQIFVPVIVVFVVALNFAWLVVDESFAQSFYRAMAVLVAASPCALAIATPSAVLSGVARAARGGVLIKGGVHLESLGQVRAIAFDKTGTLTVGKPSLTDVVAAHGTDEARLLGVALAVERQSDHPLALAIVKGGAQRLGVGAAVPEATNVEAIVGFGVRASVDRSEVLIGKPGLFTRDSPLPPDIADAVARLQGGGRTVMVVSLGGRFLGVLGVMDTPRSNAAGVVTELHRLGIENTIMLTGDNQQAADAIARHVGIRSARGDQLPEQKVAAIAELARSATRVAMVGDGVNDAPAMANATVGIAMGAGSSDVALETADVALMADDLGALPFAIGLSRAARRVIRQNLWASLGMVVFLVPATVFGFAGIGVAVAFHEGSTLLVVANALRLLAHRSHRGSDERSESHTQEDSR